MRPFLKTLAVLSLFLALAAGKVFSQDAAVTTFVHTDDDFSIQAPADWDIRKDVTYQVYSIPFLAVRPVASADDSFRENMNMISEKVAASLSIEDYFAANLKGMGKQLEAFDLLGQGDLKGGASPGKYMIYTHGSGDQTLKVLVFFYLHAGRGYCLTCTATPKTFNSYMKTFLSAGRSVAFLDASHS